MIDVGKLIRDRRTALGMTQKELGRRVYVSNAHISNIETHKHMCSLRTFNDLLEVLGMEMKVVKKPEEPISDLDMGNPEEW